LNGNGLVSCLWLCVNFGWRNTVACILVVVVRSSTFDSSTLRSRRLLRLPLFVLENVLVVVETFQRTTPAAFGTISRVDIRTADWEYCNGCIGLPVACEGSLRTVTAPRAPALTFCSKLLFNYFIATFRQRHHNTKIQ